MDSGLNRVKDGDKMYHIAVCDDNQEEAHLIGRMTQEIMAQREIEAQVDLFFDPESLLDKLQQTQIQYDLFLLDILMEERNGIQLAQALRQRGYRGKLIYITVSRDYAIDGYKVKADDYLLKPVEKDTLDQAIGRVLPRLETVLLETTGGMKILQLQQILYAESTGHYVLIQLGDKGEPLRLRATLLQVQQKLGAEKFVRCHKGYLVNLAQVREVRVSTSQILLHGGDAIPLGRQYRYEVQKAVVQYVEQAISSY